MNPPVVITTYHSQKTPFTGLSGKRGLYVIIL